MTADVWLLAVQQFLLLLFVPMTVVLVRAALRKPRIWALTVMASLTSAIAVLVVAYQLAVLDKAVGYPVPQDTVTTIFRFIVVALELVPLLFFLVYITRRFRDTE